MVTNSNKKNIPPVKSKRPRGRPVAQESAQLEKDLLDFWNEGVRSETAIANLLNLNKNTVSKHFKKFKDAILKNEYENAFEADHLARDEAMSTLDGINAKLLVYQLKMEKEIEAFDGIAEQRKEENKTAYKSMHYGAYNKLLEIFRLRSEIAESKHKIKMSPTLDQVMEKEVAAYLEKMNVVQSPEGKRP